MKLLLNETEHAAFLTKVEELEAQTESAQLESDLPLFERAALLTLIHTGAELVVAVSYTHLTLPTICSV